MSWSVNTIYKDIYRDQVWLSICGELENDLYHDTTIQCKDGESIRISSFLLATISPYISSILRTMHGLEEYYLVMIDVDSSQLKEMLQLTFRIMRGEWGLELKELMSWMIFLLI